MVGYALCALKYSDFRINPHRGATSKQRKSGEIHDELWCVAWNTVFHRWLRNKDIEEAINCYTLWAVRCNLLLLLFCIQRLNWQNRIIQIRVRILIFIALLCAFCVKCISFFQKIKKPFIHLLLLLNWNKDHTHAPIAGARQALTCCWIVAPRNARCNLITLPVTHQLHNSLIAYATLNGWNDDD